jgi:peptide/nickel transport system permease protein
MNRRVGRVLLRTLLQAIPAAIVIIIIAFLLLKLAPGDAADALAAVSGSATEETMAAWRRQFGLDQGILGQLLLYLWGILHLDLGVSPLYNQPVLDLILERMPASLLLMASGLALAVLIGVAFGTLMALSRGGWLDRILSVVVLLLYSVPGFWIGLMLIIVFSVTLGWFPIGGAETIGAQMSGLERLADRLHHLVLPASALAAFYIAVYARLMRNSTIEVLQRDFVRTALAKGMTRRQIVFGHVIPNALLPVTTMIGMQMGAILGGSIVIETVFSWPGLGSLAFDAILKRDFSVILGILLLSALLVLVINAVTDVVQAWLDPRIELD